MLTDYPDVRQSVAAVRVDDSGTNRLVAYVVANQERVPTTSDLRGFLKDKLPEYMIPSAFVILDDLPLTPNGKLDRKALPALAQSRPDLRENFLSPRDATEQTIAEIWAQVLEVDRVGVYDNFFDLGGHSLLATQVMSRLRESFQTEIPLRALFENSTVAELAVQIQAQVKSRPDGKIMGRGQAPAKLVPNADPLGGEHFFVDVPMPGFLPWTYEQCPLYVAEVTLAQNGRTLDQLSFRFGMREITVKDRNYKLNGKNLWLRGSNLVFEWNWEIYVRVF